MRLRMLYVCVQDLVDRQDHALEVLALGGELAAAGGSACSSARAGCSPMAPLGLTQPLSSSRCSAG